MAACKDCIHYDVCYALMQSKEVETFCNHFKDKSRYIELPCKVGTRHNKLTFIAVDEEKTKEKHRTYYILRCDYGKLESYKSYHFEKLTREEAEKALKEREKK